MKEILILNLRPGTRDRFHEIYIAESLPIQKKWNIEVVAHGPSEHDDNSYWVVRSFKSLDDRKQSEDTFYASDDWRKGPRAALLALIESSAAVVVSDETINGWLPASDSQSSTSTL